MFLRHLIFVFVCVCGGTVWTVTVLRVKTEISSGLMWDVVKLHHTELLLLRVFAYNIWMEQAVWMKWEVKESIDAYRCVRTLSAPGEGRDTLLPCLKRSDTWVEWTCVWEREQSTQCKVHSLSLKATSMHTHTHTQCNICLPFSGKGDGQKFKVERFREFPLKTWTIKSVKTQHDQMTLENKITVKWIWIV